MPIPMSQVCWYVDRNDNEFADFRRAFKELLGLGLVDHISLEYLTYQQADQLLDCSRHPAIVIVHPSDSSSRAKRLCQKLDDLKVVERWTYSAEIPDWPEELATRHYQKPVSLQLLLRELEHSVELMSQDPSEDERSLEDSLSIVEKKLPFPVGYWEMGGFLIEDIHTPAYLNEYWKNNIVPAIDQSLANQIRAVSEKLLLDFERRKKEANEEGRLDVVEFRKQRFKNKKGDFELYNIIFSQVNAENKRWLRVGLSPSTTKPQQELIENYLETMMLALAESYEITRLRLYATHQIEVNGKENYLLIPIASFGGGHTKNKHKNQIDWQREEEDGLKTWLSTPFLYTRAEPLSLVEQSNSESLVANNKGLCPMMCWGEAENRLLKFIVDPDKPSKTPSALLVLDKRTDHVKYAHKKFIEFETLPYMRHMQVFASTDLGAGTVHKQKIDAAEVSRMSVNLDGFCKAIYRRLNKRSEKTLESLNFNISKGFADATDKFGREIDPAKKILQHFLEAIPSIWQQSQSKLPLLSDCSDNLKSIKNSATGGEHNLENLYVAILENGRWHLLAGHGDYIAGIIKPWDSDILFNHILKSLESDQKKGGVAKVVIANNFKKTVEESPQIGNKIEKMPPLAKESIKSINSWLGIPIHLAGGAKAAFVFQSTQQYYFTKKRAEHLKKLARRTISLINWCHFEETAQTYEHAMRHEILTPLSALPEDVKQLPPIRLLRNFIDNLAYLQTKNKTTGSAVLKESFSQLKHLNSFYDDVFNWPDSLPNFKCALPQSILDQILYILLSNAGRYARYETQVTIITSTLNNKCTVTVINSTNSKINNTALLYEPKQRNTNSGVDSGSGLGLYVFKQLQKQYGFKGGVNFDGINKLFIARIELEEYREK